MNASNAAESSGFKIALRKLLQKQIAGCNWTVRRKTGPRQTSVKKEIRTYCLVRISRSD
jgi:hypothetical protein